MHLRRLALSFRQRSTLVLGSEFAEVKVDFLLREVVVLPELPYETLYVHLVLFLGAYSFIPELGLPACLLG